MTSTANAQAHDSVSVEQLEEELTRIRLAARGAQYGIFGPDSLMWRVSREAAIFLGAGRALLLQLAHPWVAAAVAEHSRTLEDPIGRFHRTFDVVFTLVFGTIDQAFAAARALHRRHMAIRGRLPDNAGPFAAGSSYCANDIAALTWVYATLIDSALVARDLVFAPLPPQERDRYYAESQLFAGLFGVPRHALPATWQAFATYNEAMWRSEILTVTAEARAMAQQLFHGTGMWFRVPGWYQILTADLLPPRIRTAFDLPYDDAKRLALQRAIKRIARIYPLLPPRLRYVGPYQEAQARMRGRAQPDLATQTLNWLWIGRRRLS